MEAVVDDGSGGMVLGIVWAFGALLFVLSGWAIITGRHDRFYKQFRRHGIPPAETHWNKTGPKERHP